MKMPDQPRLDRTAFSVVSLYVKSDEKSYWLSRSPHERLQHMEFLRQVNYGYRAAGRLQRILEVDQLSVS
jgi:hypothetical protein